MSKRKLQKKVKEFLEEYKELSKKYGLDFTVKLKFGEDGIKPIIMIKENK